MTKIVDVRGITKYFLEEGKRFYALSNVSISVDKGEVFGLLGPNGAGKTTLISILTTQLLPDEGGAYVSGYNILRDRYKILANINAVSAESKFHRLLNPREILEFYSKMYSIPKVERDSRIKFVVKSMEIENIMNVRFDWLSIGERMRLLLAKALLNHPKVLFLDEPTLGLDPDIAIKTRKLIKKINKDWGTTVFLTSHYMYEVEQLCKRIAFLNKGKVEFVGKVKDLKRKFNNLENYFVTMVEMK